MKNETKELAEITKVWLGIEDHGILSFYIYLDYESGGSQGYGGYCYEYRDSKTEEIIGHPLLAEHMYALMDAFAVQDWDKLVGKKCWVHYIDGGGCSRSILGIESLRKEGSKTVNLKEIAEKSSARSCSECGHTKKVRQTVRDMKDWDDAPYLLGTVVLEGKTIPPSSRLCPKCGSEMEWCAIHEAYCCDECGHSEKARP